MNSRYPLALRHSWPLWEQPRHFDHVLNCTVTDAVPAPSVGALTKPHGGLWEYDFIARRLTWSGGVYDIFGVERGTEISRETALALYSQESRVNLEQLRAYALRHKRGFTLDAEIHAGATGERRRIRIIAAPVCEGNAVVKLHGLKFVI
ncbi:MAG TPA: hypothetical protein VFR92_10770 [Sphingomicrobium sp.]|jgi:hypothetical protein|nr:hypothetical protein [Sphingomicrobium sp.]